MSLVTPLTTVCSLRLQKKPQRVFIYTIQNRHLETLLIENSLCTNKINYNVADYRHFTISHIIKGINTLLQFISSKIKYCKIALIILLLFNVISFFFFGGRIFFMNEVSKISVLLFKNNTEKFYLNYKLFRYIVIIGRSIQFICLCQGRYHYY